MRPARLKEARYRIRRAPKAAAPNGKPLAGESRTARKEEPRISEGAEKTKRLRLQFRDLDQIESLAIRHFRGEKY